MSNFMRPRINDSDRVAQVAIANNLAEIGELLEKLTGFVEDLWVQSPAGKAAIQAEEAKNDPHGGF